MNSTLHPRKPPPPPSTFPPTSGLFPPPSNTWSGLIPLGFPRDFVPPDPRGPAHRTAQFFANEVSSAVSASSSRPRRRSPIHPARKLRVRELFYIRFSWIVLRVSISPFFTPNPSLSFFSLFHLHVSPDFRFYRYPLPTSTRDSITILFYCAFYHDERIKRGKTDRQEILSRFEMRFSYFITAGEFVSRAKKGI